MWYAGIDWADDHHDAVVVDDAGRVVLTLRIAHTVAGLAQLTTALAQICGPTAKEQLACIVETNHGLLISALLSAGFPVYPVNPKTVDRRRNAAGVKTDQIDAYLLAKSGRSDLADLRRLRPDSPLILAIPALRRRPRPSISSCSRRTWLPMPSPPAPKRGCCWHCWRSCNRSWCRLPSTIGRLSAFF